MSDDELFENFLGGKVIILDKYDWSYLIAAVKKIENLDLSKLFYSWEDDEGEVRYNFTYITFEIYNNEAHIYFNWELDPPSLKFSSWEKIKEEAVFNTIIQFIEWYNEQNL